MTFPFEWTTNERGLGAADVAKRHAPPAPAQDENAPAQNIFMVARAPLANPGPQRGEIEAVLGHLAGLTASVPSEAEEQADDAA